MLVAPPDGGEHVSQTGQALVDGAGFCHSLPTSSTPLCSLRFASTVNQVELGNGKKAKRNIAHNFAHLTNGGAEAPAPAGANTRSRRVSANALASRDNSMYDRRSSAGAKRANPFAQNERAPKTRRKAWE